MSRCVLVQLAVVLISAVAFSEASSLGNSTSKADLDYHRLTNAIYPYRNEIKSTWTRRSTNAQEDSQGLLTCHLCTSVMPLVRNWITEYTNDELRDMVIRACESMGLAPRPEICKPIITAYTKQFLYIIANTVAAENDNIPSAQICGVLAPNCDRPGLTDWQVEMPGNKPEPENRDILEATASSTTTILQFTDLHVDLHYVVGTNTDCGSGMPICCRESDGTPEDESKQAGPFGDFRCALPLDTLEHLLNHAKAENPETRYIFLTGDYIHSGVWLYNKDENGQHIRNVTLALTRVFPDKSIPIYPLVGNHEPHVVNMYPPKHLWTEEPEFDLSWLYRDVMEPFRQRDPDFLPDEEYDRFYEGGYYSVSPEPGLKIIVLNTNICSSENFWLGYNPYEILQKQLQWMTDVLKEAEDAKESVLIVGHIEPGSCFPAWSDKFNNVVERFDAIIRGSFFGHSHKPQYRVSMKKGTMEPVFASYIAGSGLPDSMHPAYSVFQVDGERGEESKWDVLRHKLVIMNLTESNSKNEPVFQTLGDSYETFKMENLSPASILKFAKSLICNQGLMNSYLNFHTKGNETPDSRQCEVTNTSCMKDILCNIVSSNAADNKPCQELEAEILKSKCSSTAQSGAEQNQIAFGIVATVSALLLFFGFQ